MYQYERGTGHGPIPLGADGAPRTEEAVCLRVSLGEKAYLRFAAARAGMDVATYVRDLACPPEEMDWLVRQAALCHLSLKDYVDQYVIEQRAAGRLPKPGRRSKRQRKL